MARPYLIFRGTSTETLGLYVTEMPSHKKASMRVTKYNLAGRDGELHVQEGLNAYDLPVKVSMWDMTANNRQVITAWADGTGKLISSDDLTRCWDASVIDEITFTRKRMSNGHFMDEATIRFHCQPYMRESVESSYVFTDDGNILNLGNVESLPLIKVTGSGNCGLAIGDQQISLTGVQTSHPVFIDSEAGYVYTDSGNATMVGNFPVIGYGTTSVTLTGGTTRLDITPRWGWV